MSVDLYHFETFSLVKPNPGPASELIALLEKMVPIQNTLQDVKSGSAPTLLPWLIYRNMWSNSHTLCRISKALDPTDEAVLVERRACSLRKWIALAMVGRSVRSIFPRIPPLVTKYVIERYQDMCVPVRTLCEDLCPELIDLVTEVL